MEAGSAQTLGAMQDDILSHIAALVEVVVKIARDGISSNGVGLAFR